MKGEECAAVDCFIDNKTFWKFHLSNKFDSNNFVQPIDNSIKKKLNL